MVAASAPGAEPTFFAARVAPILEQHCVVCHGPEKQKAELRLDSLERALRGGDAGVVIKPADVPGSELYRRITLPPDHEEFMPGDGKPPLSADEIKVLELWIRSGASASAPLSAFPDAPALKPRPAEVRPVTADWRPRAAEIAALERELGIRLVPRSQVATDGLILRTASAPRRCDDAALRRLRPVAELIVEAELARTPVTDTGLAALGAFANLRRLDLTRTKITSAGLRELAGLRRLEALNLTGTAVDAPAVEALRQLPELKGLWFFATPASPDPAPSTVVAH